MSQDPYRPTKQEFIFPAHGVRTVMTWDEDRRSSQVTETFELSQDDKQDYAQAIDQDLMIIRGYQYNQPTYQHSYRKDKAALQKNNPGELTQQDYTVAHGQFLNWHPGTNLLSAATPYQDGFVDGTYTEWAKPIIPGMPHVNTLEIDMQKGMRTGRYIRRFPNNAIYIAAHYGLTKNRVTPMLIGNDKGKLIQTAYWIDNIRDVQNIQNVAQEQSMEDAVNTYFDGAPTAQPYRWSDRDRVVRNISMIRVPTPRHSFGL